MTDKLEIKSLFGTRWTFRALNMRRGLAIHAYKSGNKSDDPDVFVGLSHRNATQIRDFLVEQFGPGEGYVKVDEGLVNATAEEVPERKFKVGDRIRIKAGAGLDNVWIGRVGTITSVNPGAGYHYRARMDGDTNSLDLALFEDEVEPEPEVVNWKYQVGDRVRSSDSLTNKYLKFDRGEVTNIDTLDSGDPESPYAYTVKHGDGYMITYKESELTPYVGPKLGDALAEYPLGTIIHFDCDAASGTWVKHRDAWYSSRNAVKMSFLLDRPASRFPFKVIYNPDTDN